MFDKFGELDSVEELNMAAEGFKNEGDLESLYALAKENGIDREDAEDYINGDCPELATLAMAAYGRLAVQKKEIEEEKDRNIKRAKMVILDMTQTLCSDTEFQRAVIKKEKRVSEILETMKKAASEHKDGGMGVACGTDKELRDIIEAYFLNGELEKTIEKLYE